MAAILLKRLSAISRRSRPSDCQSTGQSLTPSPISPPPSSPPRSTPRHLTLSASSCRDKPVAQVIVWNKDSVFGVIGIQSGPLGRRVHNGFHEDHGSWDKDADCGDDSEDPSGI